MKNHKVLMDELRRIREEFEAEHHRPPTPEEIRMMDLAEKLLRDSAAKAATQV